MEWLGLKHHHDDFLISQTETTTHLDTIVINELHWSQRRLIPLDKDAGQAESIPLQCLPRNVYRWNLLITMCLLLVP